MLLNGYFDKISVAFSNVPQQPFQKNSKNLRRIETHIESLEDNLIVEATIMFSKIFY